MRFFCISPLRGAIKPRRFPWVPPSPFAAPPTFLVSAQRCQPEGHPVRLGLRHGQHGAAGPGQHRHAGQRLQGGQRGCQEAGQAPLQPRGLQALRRGPTAWEKVRGDQPWEGVTGTRGALVVLGGQGKAGRTKPVCWMESGLLEILPGEAGKIRVLQAAFSIGLGLLEMLPVEAEAQ